MQKTKIAAEELAEMIRDGLAEVHLRLVAKEATLRSIDVATHSQPIEYGAC